MSAFPIIAKLGGREAVMQKLPSVGLTATRDQIRMWEARSRIPGEAQVALMRLAEHVGIEYVAADFETAPSLHPAEASP